MQMSDDDLPELPLIHRDDLDYEVAEVVEEMFGELYPGFKVVYAGDRPDLLPDEVKEKVEALQAAMRDSMLNGTCLQCRQTIPATWPPPDEGPWEWPRGWGVMRGLDGNPLCLDCGCFNEESDHAD